jgi:hypothetical protein
MSNKYIDIIRVQEGSQNWGFVNNLISNVSGGQITSSKDLVSKVKSQSKVQSKRIDKITALSETNMQLLEEDLKLLDKTLQIYNVAGVFAISSGILGTILLAMKLKNGRFRS